MKIDIHNYPKMVERAVKLVRKSNISSRNKELILEFRDYCSLEGISLARISRYMGILKDWALLIKKDFDIAKKQDIIGAVRVIQEKDNYSPWTKLTYKTMLKRFYRWVKGTEESPEEVKWIKTTMKRNEKKLPSNGELLTEEDVKKLISAAEHPRDKAFVSCLYESGARVGELAGLVIGSVKIDEYGAVLNVTGKTGPRPIRIISSTPYLVTWLNMHPVKDNESALWVNIGNTNHNLPMKYATVSGLLKKVFNKAGIKKRFNPHIFRHSRATFLADHLTEFQMNQYFGWIQGSKMPSTYIHMSGKKIDASILALNGIKNKEEKESIVKPVICPRCDTINTFDAKYCTKCAGILDIKTAYELEAKVAKEKEFRKNSDELMNVLLKDSDFLSMFVRKVKELGLQEKVV